MQAHAIADANPFAGAREQFEVLVVRLGGDETARMTHADVERLLQSEGAELLRRMYQGHLDARGVGEAAGAVVGADGIARTHARVSERPLVTVFGAVQVARMGYGQRKVESLYPRDAELNVPPEIYSHGVRRQVAEEAARGSFDETVKAIGRTTGADVAKRQVEQLATRAATDFDAFYDSRATATPAQANKTAPILVLTTDGKGVVMRPEALREATEDRPDKRDARRVMLGHVMLFLGTSPVPCPPPGSRRGAGRARAGEQGNGTKKEGKAHGNLHCSLVPGGPKRRGRVDLTGSCARPGQLSWAA